MNYKKIIIFHKFLREKFGAIAEAIAPRDIISDGQKKH